MLLGQGGEREEVLNFEPVLLEGVHDVRVILVPMLAHDLITEVEDLALKHMLHRSRRVPLNVQIRVVNTTWLFHGVL